ncbi:MAG: hypothetical protein ACK44W_06070, partial [Planctomycetota bacterium]
MRIGIYLAFCLAAQAGAPQDPNRKPGQGFKPNPAVDQKNVDEAIRRGLEYLKTSDSPSGAQSSHSNELKLLTFIHGGLSEDDPALQALLKQCLEAPLERTYNVSLLAMCLEELDRVKYQGKIVQCAQFLIDNLRADGGFSYGEPTVYALEVPTTASRREVASGGGRTAAEREREKPPVQKTVRVRKMKEGPAQRSDNSNSQYGALGMRACHDAGVVFPREWVERARAYWLTNQHPGEKGKNDRSVATGAAPLGDPRGWCYDDGDGNACEHGGQPYGSMTAGAIGAVCIYDYMLKKDWKKDKAVLDGLAWLDRYWSVTENGPTSETARGAKSAWLYYYLYAVERAGMLYDTALIGNHDWYLEGARQLLAAQRP